VPAFSYVGIFIAIITELDSSYIKIYNTIIVVQLWTARSCSLFWLTISRYASFYCWPKLVGHARRGGLVKPSERIGLLPGFSWIADKSIWLAMSFGFIATIGLLYAVAMLIEGRVPRVTAQYKGVFPGDLFLATSVAASMYVAHCKLPDVHGAWYQSRTFHYSALLLGVVLVVGLKVAEITATIKMPGQPGVYSWNQQLSPTMLAHTAIVPVMAYLTVVSAAAALSTASISWWLKAVVVAGILGWILCAVVLDNILPRPNVTLIHPSNGWPWQR